MLLVADSASAITCSLPGESQPVSDTPITLEQAAAAESLQPWLRTAYGRNGLPGVPLGPLYATLADGTVAPIKPNWEGPKRIVMLYGNSNLRDTGRAVIPLLVKGIPELGIPPVASDIGFINHGASLHGVLGWSDTESGYWQDARSKWKGAKVGPSTQVLYVTPLPEVKLNLFGLVGLSDDGGPMQASDVLDTIGIADSMMPEALAVTIDMSYEGWVSKPASALYNEGRAHSDYLVFRSISEARTEGRVILHYANHAQTRNCLEDYHRDGVHNSLLGYDRIAAEMVAWLYRTPAFAWMWEQAVLP